MRVIVPPLTSQYLNLTKNSSLAVPSAIPIWFRSSPAPC
jgi:ABC-type amino acid transport system permease subunit